MKSLAEKQPDSLQFEEGRQSPFLQSIADNRSDLGRHDTEASYRELFERSPAAMWVCDQATLQILAANRAAFRQYGYEQEEVLAMTFCELCFLPERPLKLLLESGMGMLESSSAVSHRKKDGTMVTVQISTNQIIFNKCPAYLVSSRDLTDEHAVEEHHREQATVLQQVREAIVVRDLDHIIRFWNPAAARLYGWASEEAVGERVNQLFSLDNCEFLRAQQTVLQHGEWAGELQHITKAGIALMIESRWTLLRDRKGQAKSILAIDTDITERKKIEAHVFRTQRLESIGTLAGGIAHDLNNILAPIIMGIEMLKAEEKNVGRCHIFDMIEVSAKRGAGMVKQVLSFARGSEGERVETQMVNLLKDVGKIVCETFPKNIKVRNLIPSGLAAVVGDATQIHQVILNLCVNARDAMPTGGTLTISAENVSIDRQLRGAIPGSSAGRFVSINVTDTGIGMSPETMDKVFDPFFTTKVAGKGTGLGLSTSLGIVKSHGGFIRVHSDPGEGSQFTVYLPSIEPNGFAPIPSEEPLLRGNGELILVVDDEESIREVTRQTLESFGYRVLLAEDGTEAIASYGTRRTEIAVVLTDMDMPVMDGLATIMALRKMDPNVRIIAASGLQLGGGKAETDLAGVTRFMQKPYSAAEMLKLLRRVLESDPEKSAFAESDNMI